MKSGPLLTILSVATLVACEVQQRSAEKINLTIAMDGPVAKDPGVPPYRDILDAMLPIENQAACGLRVLVPQAELARLDSGKRALLFGNDPDTLTTEAAPPLFGFLHINLSRKLPDRERLEAATREKLRKLDAGMLAEAGPEPGKDRDSRLMQLIAAQKPAAVILYGAGEQEAQAWRQQIAAAGLSRRLDVVPARDIPSLQAAVARARCSERSEREAVDRADMARDALVFFSVRKPDGTGEAAQQASRQSSRVEAQRVFDRGLMFAAARDDVNAIREFTAAIRLHPQYAVAYANRGVAYLRQKKYDMALRDLQEAVKLAPDDPHVHYNLAALYSLRNQIDLGIESLDQALALGFASKEPQEIDMLKPGQVGDADLKNLRRSPDYCRTLEKRQKFLC